MAERKLNVFLCHSSGDKPAVRALYQRLRADGVDPWLDEEDLLPGQKWEQEIPKAVRAADAIVVCLSRSSTTKEGYVQKEIKLALDVAEEKPDGTIFFIPLKLEDCDIPERLKGWHAGSLEGEKGYERLRSALQLRATQLGVTVTVSHKIWRNSLGMEFILIPAGEFQMGSMDGRDNEKPVHLVRITKPFYLGTYQVTQEQWQAVMGNNPSRFKGDLNRPVETVSWHDAQRFLQRLNERDVGKAYRLPTEAEWEYAARGGSRSKGYVYSGSNDIDAVAWYKKNSNYKKHPVKGKAPNELGLYDMTGNVYEWCSDWYAKYGSEPSTNPTGPNYGDQRVLRGGTWRFDAYICVVTWHYGYYPHIRDTETGFRLAKSVIH
ncbi:MAG: SUMF1/EgtB/PvdO family nonheme iron enzyme [Saprospiraceae bacterium]|nr:SUMF1/EgtB/PvdO family nonheme iron enzyme [Saprospiraceae bacterium]